MFKCFIVSVSEEKCTCKMTFLFIAKKMQNKFQGYEDFWGVKK